MKLRINIPTETIAMALGTIRAHKLRSFLTVLGIVIGVVVVIAVASILTGLRGRIVAMVEEYGTNNIYAFHLTTGPQFGDRDRSEYQRKPLRPEDGEAILRHADAIEEVANILFLWRMDGTIKYRGQSYREGDLSGVSASFASVTNVSMQEGRFITEMDEQHRREVMVIGVNVAESLFPHQASVVGTQVDLAGRPFEIIGVLEKRKNSFFGENGEDNAVFIPFETGRKLSPRSEEMMLHIRAKSGMLAAGLTQVEDVLRRQRKLTFSQPNNFDLSTADRIIEQFDGITLYVGLFAIAISAVGLLVGGIGVMNIMLVSVTERTKEIGVRKSIGARSRDILRQFLTEAVFISEVGGILGIILGVIGGDLLAMWLKADLIFPFGWAIAGLVVCSAIGIGFGLYPAYRAASLDPIEALRYE
jgi:putative ABC transport system permease protein